MGNRRTSCNSARIVIAVSVSMPAEASEPPDGLAIRRGVRQGRQGGIQRLQSRLDLGQRQTIIVHDLALRLVLPGQTVHPPGMRLRPGAAGGLEPTTQQQLPEPMPTPLPITSRIVAGPDQIPGRFLGRRRWVDFGQQPRAQQLRQLPCIAPIRLRPDRPACAASTPAR